MTGGSDEDCRTEGSRTRGTSRRALVRERGQADQGPMELVPRITRAQKMDSLSSQATAAGYKAVCCRGAARPRFFPMLMTAAGTVPPARVLVLGAGVAGLQAIATARRLGAVVQGFDIRPAVKEQVESLGAQWVGMELEEAEGRAATRRRSPRRRSAASTSTCTAS
jgi:H+-translocating NAD(P) transhydrogenase subunit alpha